MQIQNNQIAISKGTGYWDLTRYPWGGSFHRATGDSVATLVRIIDTYTNGAPRRIVAQLAGKEIGVTL